MKRWVLGVVCGVALASAAHGQEGATRLAEIPVATVGHAAFSVPKGYGRLVDVTESSGVHHLYFEDGQGVIRMVLIGPRGAATRARHTLELLSTDVYVIKRGQGGAEAVPGEAE